MSDSLPTPPARLPTDPPPESPGPDVGAGAVVADPSFRGNSRLHLHPLFWLATAALLLAAWQWTETRQRLATTQEEVARRLAEESAVAREARAMAKQAQEGAVALQTRLGVLETRLAESQSQQAALEGLYQELARGRDEWALAEVEQIVALAAQQLQLAGNVQAAVMALGQADARLARADRPQFQVLRKAIARDLGRLRALPFVDLTGISVKLESVVTATDTLALAFEERPRPPAKPKSEPKAAAPSSLAGVEAWWKQLAGEIWDETRSLVRIERFDRPEPALLSPTHAFFLRENLKLRLLNARLALLARDQGTFRGEIRQAQVLLERHFEPRDKAVQAAAATLRPLGSADVIVDVPNLNETLSALRTVRLGRTGKDGAP